MTFKSKQLSHDECLAQAEDCRAIVSTACNGETRIMLESMAQRWEWLADEPQRTRGSPKLVKLANGPDERREFQALEQSVTVLADNAQRLVGNHDKTVRRTEPDQSGNAAPK